MAKSIKQLDAEIQDCLGKMQAIVDESTEKNNGKLSAENQKTYDELNTTLASLESELKDAEDFDARQKDLDARKAKAEKALASLDTPRRITTPDPLVGGDRIEVTEKLAAYNIGGQVVHKKAFLSLGDQLQAIAGVALSGRDNEMLAWEQLAVATGGAAAGVPSDGGYLIQKDFATELFSRMSSAGSLSDPQLPQVRSIPIGPNSDGLKLNVVDETSRATGSRWGGVQVYWGSEADAATAKKPKLRQMELELKELIGLAYATNRLLQDASALEAVFIQAFSEEMAWMKEDARINGTGAGQPKGIVSTTGASATIEVAKETGQDAATVLYKNIVKMWARLWSRSRMNAVWLVNQDVEPSLHQMTMPVGTGGVPVYLPPGGVSDAPYGRLMGRPVVAVEYCKTLGTAGDIILWDPTQYIEITKGGLQADQSVHVRFTTNENTFRFITRVDGQPLWNSAISPSNGTNTQSPQITLATRA